MSVTTRQNKNLKSTITTPDAVSPAAANSNFMKCIELKFEEMKVFLKGELKQSEDRLMSRLGDMKAEITNVRTELNLLKNKYKTLNKYCEDVVYDVDKLNIKVSALENNAVAADVILMNVPSKADPDAVVNKLFEKIDCPLETLKVFRMHNNLAKESVPIIAKLKSPDDRIQVFKTLAQFRKKNKRQLNLGDCGLAGEKDVFLHECLSSFNIIGSC